MALMQNAAWQKCYWEIVDDGMVGLEREWLLVATAAKQLPGSYLIPA
jgi:hypothetical protein